VTARRGFFAQVFRSMSSPAAIRSASALISAEPVNVDLSDYVPARTASCDIRVALNTRINPTN
jgi:hypothetical protein